MDDSSLKSVFLDDFRYWKNHLKSLVLLYALLNVAAFPGISVVDSINNGYLSCFNLLVIFTAPGIALAVAGVTYHGLGIDRYWKLLAVITMELWVMIMWLLAGLIFHDSYSLPYLLFVIWNFAAIGMLCAMLIMLPREK